MTKLQIYNLALAQHGKRCTAAEMSAESKPHEVDACDTMFDVAVQNVLGEYDWSFCVVPMQLERDDDEPYGDWAHGYHLPYGMLRLARVENGTFPFMVANNRFYCDEDDPKIWGIPSGVAYSEMWPADFSALIGLWLAFLISPIVSPSDNNLSSRILQTYSAQLQTLMRRELNGVNDNYLPEEDWGRRL